MRVTRETAADAWDPCSRAAHLTSATSPPTSVPAHLVRAFPSAPAHTLSLLGLALGDVIVVCTDGVHDNLDPEHLGKLPADVGLRYRTWDECPNKQLEDAKSQFACQRMEEMCGRLVLTCAVLLTSVSASATARRRRWLHSQKH